MIRVDTILNLLAYGAALLGYAALFPSLETLPRILLPLALLYGSFADRRGRALPAWLVTASALGLFVFYAVQVGRQNLVLPVTQLLVVFLAVRLASGKSFRNYLQIFALALFTLAASALFTLSAAFLVYLLLLLLVIGVALVFLTCYAVDASTVFTLPQLRKMAGVALFMTLLALPLMLFFFFILPRTQYPLWHFLNQAAGRTAGLADRVTPGSAASVGALNGVVFRATAPPLPKNRLYWRGIVLNSYERNSWSRREPPVVEVNVPTGKELLTQTIYPEPGQGLYLVSLNYPRRIGGIRENAAADLVHSRSSAGFRRGKYEAVSTPGDTLVTPRGINRDFYLATPRELSSRVAALGREVAKRKDDESRIAWLEEYFSTRKFLYATSDLPVSGDPLDEFLFSKKRGNCEFFASAAALLLRLGGVPTRLVGGYYGGSYNDMGGYYVVTEDLAHVWVEAHVAGRGWVTIDPSSWAANAELLRRGQEVGVVRRLQLTLDALSYFWNLTVINYDFDRQFQLLNGANDRLKGALAMTPPLRGLAVGTLAVVSVLMLLVAGRYLRCSREERLLRMLRRRVARTTGQPLSPAMGLHDVAKLLDHPAINRFVDLYGGIVYRDRKLTAEEFRLLRRLLEESRS
jgi:transglutaminase-like putative cysteine protease